MTLQRPKVQQVLTGRGDDPTAAVAPSAAALAANKRLEELRRAAGVTYRRPGAVDSRAWLADLADNAPASTVEDDPARASTTATHAEPGAGLDQLDGGGPLAGVMATVYPSLAAVFLASKHVAPVGRLWLLLRTWDTAGRGCYTLDQVYRAFSVEGSAWRVAERRQVQRLIKAGAGTFWTLRDYQGGRYHGLQMTGPAGVAAALGLDRLAGAPVVVPVADLLGGMHRAAAALFATVATLRRPRRAGRGPRPVTRETLAGITGRAASTQRTYSKTAHIEAQPNYVILPSGDVDAPGAFVMVDHLGLQGQAGRAHLARQMPNSYVVPLVAASRGRQRKINRRLNLVISEARGYRPEVDYRRIYHDTATGAARAYGRNYHDDHYWPVGLTAAGAGLWHMVEAVNQ